jgi:D-amino-acid dehydrogenase
VWTPSEEVADPHALAEALVARLHARGAQLRFGAPVVGLLRRNGRVLGVQTTAGEVLAEQVVLCAGHASRRLARPLGLSLPIEPIKGYSVTLAIRQPALAPRVSITDARRKVVYAPLGDTLRVAGMAELVGEDTTLDARRVASLVESAQQTFPGACDASDVRPWAGLRPATPGGVPLIGPSRIDGLWLNTGHGSLGLTLACGSAQRIAEAVLGADRAGRRIAPQGDAGPRTGVPLAAPGEPSA